MDGNNYLDFKALDMLYQVLHTSSYTTNKEGKPLTSKASKVDL
jgi:hypothetical protein